MCCAELLKEHFSSGETAPEWQVLGVSPSNVTRFPPTKALAVAACPAEQTGTAKRGAATPAREAAPSPRHGREHSCRGKGCGTCSGGFVASPPPHKHTFPHARVTCNTPRAPKSKPQVPFLSPGDRQRKRRMPTTRAAQKNAHKTSPSTVHN